MRGNNDKKKHKVLYTWEINNKVLKFPCVQDFVFLQMINSKHSIRVVILIKQIAPKLNFNGLLFLYALTVDTFNVAQTDVNNYLCLHWEQQLLLTFLWKFYY